MASPMIIRLSGPFGPALAVLGGVVLFLTFRATWTAVRGNGKENGGGNGNSGSLLRAQTNAVLFWGVASAVLGFLGQCHGAYLALNSILAAAEISPQIVAEGFVISFVPTLFGLGILAFAFVAWVTLRFFPRGGLKVFLTAFAVVLATGCSAESEEGPAGLEEGLWTLQAGPNLFLWEFTSGTRGELSCMVHDYLEGLKYMETPCASVDLAGEALAIEMPNGVRYEGSFEAGKGLIDGSLLYLDGSSREAPLQWAPASDFPTLQPRAPESGPYSLLTPEDLGDGLAVANPAEEGVSPGALERTVKAVLEGEAGFLKSLLVLRGGRLVLEEYFHGHGPDDLTPIQSVTKSISSLLVGVALREGHISGVSAPLLDFFPGSRDGAGSGWERLTLENLLTMSMALDWSPEEAAGLHGTGPEAFRRILARNVVGSPGQDWEYVNMNVNLLAGVLHQAVGEHAEALAARALFEPLGITRWNWDYGKNDGFDLMDGSLRLRPRDMAKIGVMVLNGGEWQGERILDEGWIRESLTPRLSDGSPERGYGYLWWTREVPGPDGGLLHAVFANGWGSQFILLFPELDLVVVTTGGNQENGKHMAIGEILLRDLIPGVGSGPS